MSATQPGPVEVAVAGLACPYCHDPIEWVGLVGLTVAISVDDLVEVTLTGRLRHRCAT